MPNDDLAEFIQALRALAQRTQNLRPVLTDIAGYQERQYQKAFDANRSPDGIPWQPLAPSTLAQKRNPKMLTEDVGRIPGSRFSEVTNNKVVVGYGDPLAAIHDQGATIPERVVVPKNKKALFGGLLRHPIKRAIIPATRLPARPLIGYSEQDIQEWRELVLIELTENF